MPYVLVFLAALTCSCLHLARYQQFSPIDELRHLDYAIKLSHGQLTHYGDKVGEIAMREEMCRGVDLVGWVEPPCKRKKIDPVEFRDDGWQTASPHPPLYYLGAGLTARMLGGIGLTESYVAGARLFSALLTALGVALTFYLARRVTSSAIVSSAISLAVLAFPAILHSSGIVTPDSASLVVGAAIATAVIRYRERQFSAWWFAFLGVIAGAIKLTNVFAAAAGALFLVLASGVIRKRSYKALDTRERRLIIGGLILFLTATLMAIVWLAIDSARATIDPSIIPQNVVNHFSGWPPLEFLLKRDTALQWLPPSDGYIQMKFAPEIVRLFRWLLEIMLGGAVVAAVLRVRAPTDVGTYVSLTALTAVLGAPLFSMASTKFSATLVQVQGRYGLCLLPMMLVGLGMMAESPFGRRALATFGFVAYGIVVACLLKAPTLQ